MATPFSAKSGSPPPSLLRNQTPAPASDADCVPAGSSLGALLDLVGESFAKPRPFADVCASLPPERFVSVRGQRVHVVQQGRGEPLVLVHGFGCSSHSWRQTIPLLARRYRVIAPDLNGFGWTERPRDASAYTFEGQSRMLLGVLEALGVERFHLAGHSYGGGLALWMAAQHPQRIRTLTLVSSVLPDYGDKQRQPWARFRGLNWLIVHFFVLSRGAVRKALGCCYDDPALVTEELVDEYRDRLLVEGVEDAYYGLMAPTEATSREVDLSSIRVPTLVLWGDRDRLIPHERAAPYFAPLSHAEMAIIERCGHSPMEEHPAESAARMMGFLDRHRERWTDRLAAAWRRFLRSGVA